MLFFVRLRKEIVILDKIIQKRHQTTKTCTLNSPKSTSEVQGRSNEISQDAEKEMDIETEKTVDEEKGKEADTETDGANIEKD